MVSKISSKSHQSKSTSQKLLPSSATNDLLQMTPKKIGFQEHVYHCLSSYHRIFDTKIQALRLAKVRPSSKSSPMGSVCPVMDRGEKMERPQPVGTGGTTFDYLQQHLVFPAKTDLRLWDCHGGWNDVDHQHPKKWQGG